MKNSKNKSFQTKPDVCLVPYKGHLAPLLRRLEKQSNLHVFRYRDMHMDVQASYFQHTHRFFTFGLQEIFNLFRKEIYTPVLILGLKKKLLTLKPKNVIVFDFYHWYTWQCFSFVASQETCNMFIYSETFRWPEKKIPYFFLKFCLYIAQKNERSLAGIFVYTQTSKIFLQSFFPKTSIYIIPASVDISQWAPTLDEQSADKTVRLLCNARYSARKRHEDIFLAVAQCAAAGQSVTLTCIGRPEDGKQALEAMVQQLGLAEYVSFVPATNDQIALRKLYHKHDVLVLASDKEAIGMVVPEAMSCGLATITSDAVGANVYVIPGETGIIFPVGDVSMLAQAIKTYSDPVLRHRYALAGATRIAEKFSTHCIADQLMAILEDNTN